MSTSESRSARVRGVFRGWARAVPAIALAALMLDLAVAWRTPTGAQGDQPRSKPEAGAAAAKSDELLVVDCLLPGQIRRLGRQTQFLTARRPLKTSARDCQIRGGEYVEVDRADYASALKVWLALAGEGDPAAQTYVGEIYEKGLGVPPDYAEAAQWYRRAADAGFARAAVNLGSLFEQGRGVAKDPQQAVQWYRRAAGLKDVAFEVEPPSSRPAADAPAGSAGSSGGSSTARPIESPPPVIHLLEPVLAPTRGAALSAVTLPAPAERLLVLGRVAASRGVRTLTVNGRPEVVDSESLFTAQVAVTRPEEKVEIVVTDQDARAARLEFMVLRPPAATASAPARPAPTGPRPNFGTYHALVIGNDDYRSVPRLATAVNDSREVARILRDQYGFKVTALANASRYDVLAALNDMRQRLTDKDNLLIYYGGRGVLEAGGERGHWLPVDAEATNPSSWISNLAISDILNTMNVRQALVVADSCYSSRFSRASLGQVEVGVEGPERSRLLYAMAQKRSRMVMTSGVLEPLVEPAGASHSVFARSFIDVLRANADVLPGQEVFRLLRTRTASGSPRLDAASLPDYAPIRYAGHEAGDFMFVRAAAN
jgi:uncharacterized protein